MNDWRMRTTQRINVIQEMRRHYKVKRNVLYALLSYTRKWLVLALESVDNLLEEV